MFVSVKVFKMRFICVENTVDVVGFPLTVHPPAIC